MSLAKGARNLADDLLDNNGRPQQVDTSEFTLGKNLAATPAKVVYRNDLMELPQYSAQTSQVPDGKGPSRVGGRMARAGDPA